MKKLFVIVSLIIAGFAANAQVYIGGSTSFNVKADKNDDGDKTTTEASFGFSPYVGYYITDRFDIGIGIGFSVENTKNHANDTDKSSSSWNISPYVRYSLLQFGGFEVIGKGSVFLSGSNSESYAGVESQSFSTGLNVTPVLAYNLNDHFMLFTNLNFASFGYSTTIVKDGNTTSKFGFSANTGDVLNVGGITIGFLYKF